MNNDYEISPKPRRSLLKQFRQDSNSLLENTLHKLRDYRQLLNFKDKKGEYYSSSKEFRRKEEKDSTELMDPEFKSAFTPTQMRCIALVSHNNMKATMKKFVIANKNVLKNFRLTGTRSTMTMLQDVFQGDPDVVFGASCESGPLGGDAQLVAQICNGSLGGIIFFQDPMESHAHYADIECLNRQALIYNVMIAHNPTSALMMMSVLRDALKGGKAHYIPSFFFSLESPSVQKYKENQEREISKHLEVNTKSDITESLSGDERPSRGSFTPRQTVLSQIEKNSISGPITNVRGLSNLLDTSTSTAHSSSDDERDDDVTDVITARKIRKKNEKSRKKKRSWIFSLKPRSSQ